MTIKPEINLELVEELKRGELKITNPLEIMQLCDSHFEDFEELYHYYLSRMRESDADKHLMLQELFDIEVESIMNQCGAVARHREDLILGDQADYE